MWSGDQVQDLEIGYDLRFEDNGRQPLPKNPEFPRQPGTVEIPGDWITLSESPLARGVEWVALDAATLPRLVDWGVPQDLRGHVAAELHLPIRARHPVQMVELNMEELRANMAGCLVAMLLVGSLLALALEDGFINGFPRMVD